MKAMKIWRKSRLSECHANLFANGRVRAIYVNIFVMCAAMLSLASCNSDDNVERRLTTNQKERYAQNISGEYSGEYIIIYKDKDCTDMTDEKGRHIILSRLPRFADFKGRGCGRRAEPCTRRSLPTGHHSPLWL